MKTKTVILIHKPLAAVNHTGGSGEDDLVVVTPFDGEQPARRVYVDPAIAVVVDD